MGERDVHWKMLEAWCVAVAAAVLLEMGRIVIQRLEQALEKICLRSRHTKTRQE